MITTKTITVSVDQHRLAILNAFRKKLELGMSDAFNAALVALLEVIGFKEELLESPEHTMQVLANFKAFVDKEPCTPDQMIEMLKNGTVKKIKNLDNIPLKMPEEIIDNKIKIDDYTLTKEFKKKLKLHLANQEKYRDLADRDTVAEITESLINSHNHDKAIKQGGIAKAMVEKEMEDSVKKYFEHDFNADEKSIPEENGVDVTEFLTNLE